MNRYSLKFVTCIVSSSGSRISFTVGSMDVTEGTPRVRLTVMSSNVFQEDQMVMVTATDGTAKGEN